MTEPRRSTMVEAPDESTLSLRSTLYAYLDSGCAEEYADDDEARDNAVRDLQGTMEGFLEGRLNFGTVKYRLDTASAENGYRFPSPPVTSALSDLALGVPIDDLEPAVRQAARLPDDAGAAKGAMLDFLDFLDREASRGHLKGAQVSGGRWAELLAALWHLQDRSWPLLDRAALRYLSDRGEIAPLEPAQDYAEYAAVVRDMAERAGAEAVTIEHMLSCLARDAFDVATADERYRMSLSAARTFEEEGRPDEAIERYERALSLRPDTPEALRRKAELYERKGLPMAAISELEALIELEPRNLADHRRLLALYHARKMVKEYNVEVRRFKALMLPPG